MDLADSKWFFVFSYHYMKTQEFVIHPYLFSPTFLYFTEIFQLSQFLHVYFKLRLIQCVKKNQRSQLLIISSN